MNFYPSTFYGGSMKNENEIYSFLTEELRAKLDEAGRLYHSSTLATWGLCRLLGEAFDAVGDDGKKQRAAKKYLASKYEVSKQQLGNHLRVHGVMSRIEHTDETLETVKWSSVHQAIKDHMKNGGSLDSAAQYVADMIDSGNGFIRQKAQSLNLGGVKTFWRLATKYVDEDIRKADGPLDAEQKARARQQFVKAMEEWTAVCGCGGVSVSET